MSPIEDLQSRDLAWISDFVMQQMVIMLRPMMDHLQQTDAAVDYVQRVVQRLSMDVSEVRGDIERTNKYLAILRQGLGVQNEGKCVLQRSLEGTARTVKRVDDQMDCLLGVMRSVEDSVGQHGNDLRGVSAKQEDLAKQMASSASAFEDLQSKVERVTCDAHAVRSDLLDNEARLEGWNRELRELRRNQLGLVPKYEDKAVRAPPSSQSCRADAPDTWPKKKIFTPVEVTSDKAGGTGTGFAGGNCFADTNSSHSGSSQQSKRISQVETGSGHRILPQEHHEFGVPSRSDSRVARVPIIGSSEGQEAEYSGFTAGPRDDSPAGSRLPILAAPRTPAGMSRPQDRTNAEGPRLRFPATMGGPASRGSPN